MDPPDDYTFSQIVGFGCKKNISSPSDYARAVEKGVAASKSVGLGFTSGPWVDSGQIKTFHWATYKEVYPWAGNIRTVELKKDGEFFSKPELILRDLRSLNVQARGWFTQDDLRGTAKQLAAYNAAFYQIHPFLEGNALVGRLILEYQAKEIFGHNIDLSSDMKVYRATLNQATRGNFAPLASQILEHSGLSRLADSNAIEKSIRDTARELKEKEQSMERSL